MAMVGYKTYKTIIPDKDAVFKLQEDGMLDTIIRAKQDPVAFNRAMNYFSNDSRFRLKPDEDGVLRVYLNKGAVTRFVRKTGVPYQTAEKMLSKAKAFELQARLAEGTGMTDKDAIYAFNQLGSREKALAALLVASFYNLDIKKAIAVYEKSGCDLEKALNSSRKQNNKRETKFSDLPLHTKQRLAEEGRLPREAEDLEFRIACFDEDVKSLDPDKFAVISLEQEPVEF